MKYLDAFDLLHAAAQPPCPPPDPCADDDIRLRFLERWDRIYAAFRFQRFFDTVEETVRMHGGRSRTGASALLVLSGVPYTGKSAAGYYIGERLTRETLAADGDTTRSAGPETILRVPVVRIQAAHLDTVKAGILTPIVEFYGASANRRNAAELLRQIRILAVQHETKLLIVDEISQVRMGSNSSRVVDQIKELVEAFPAPILFVGNNLDRDSIFTPQADRADPRRQLSERSCLLPCNLWSTEELQQLSCSIEHDLPLRNHETGSLDYARLRNACSSYPGRLSDLLRSAAHHAIQSGTERVTDQAIEKLAK